MFNFPHTEEIESGRKAWLLPAILFATAFMLRSYLAVFSSVITPDGILYIKTAKLIALGEAKKLTEFTFVHLYPYLILLAKKIIPDWELAGRMVSALMGSLAVVPLFLLIKRMFDVRIALVSSFFYIISPRLADYSSDVLREPTFWFFAVTSLWLAWEGISGKNMAFLVFASISTGLAAFTRTEGVAIFFIVLTWIVWFFLKVEPNRKMLFLCCGVYLLSLPVIVSPFFFLFSGQLARWDFGFIVTTKIFPLFKSVGNGTLDLQADMMHSMKPELVTFLELAKDYKYALFVTDIVIKIIKSFNVVFLFLALFGVLRRKKIPYNKNEIPVLLWFVVFFVTALFYVTKAYYLSARHGLLLGIPLLIWAGIGFYEFKDLVISRLSNLRQSSFSVRHSTGILILIICVLLLPKTLVPGGYDKKELKKAGIYLKNQGYSGVVFAGEPRLYRIAFYADSEFSSFPFVKSAAELVSLMKENNAKFLILDAKTENTFYREMQKNIDPAVFRKIDLPGLEKFREYRLTIYHLQDKQS